MSKTKKERQAGVRGYTEAEEQFIFETCRAYQHKGWEYIRTLVNKGLKSRNKSSSAIRMKYYKICEDRGESLRNEVDVEVEYPIPTSQLSEIQATEKLSNLQVSYEKVVTHCEKLHKQVLSERNRTEMLIETCLGEIAKCDFAKVARPKLNNGTKYNFAMHALRSDAQVGQEIKPQDTSGIGSYNFEIYKERIIRLRDKIIRMKEMDKNLGLNKLVSPQLGDQVDGESIYPGHAFNIDLPLVDQLFMSLEFEISEFWLPLATYFNEIELFCVYGNHGRFGKKGDHHHRTNADYFYYRMLKSRLEAAAKHIKVHVSDSPIMLVRHGNFLFEYNHGDAVRGYNGIPYYGLDRMAKRTSKMFNELIDYHLIAHFHQPANLEDCLINGCIPGGSDLSINKMFVSSRPSQKVFYFDGEEEGLTRDTNVYLDNAPVLIEGDAGVLTPVASSTFSIE